MEEDFHELGKVNRVTGKVEDKAVRFSEVSSGLKSPQMELGVDMQWEGSKYKQAPNSILPRSKVKEGDPILVLGPMTMTFDPLVGWVAEKIGPTTKHWKRLARGNQNNEPTTDKSLIKQKRESSTPLSYLDPNTLKQKGRKGKGKQSEVAKNEQKVGGVAEAAKQPR